MKKLLLLIFVIGSLVACSDKMEDVWPKDDINGGTSFEEMVQEIAKEYNIDIDGVVVNHIEESIYANYLIITGLKNEKIWIRKHNYTTKKEIFATDGKEKIDTIIKYTEPYVGEIIDTIRNFRFVSLKHKDYDGLMQIIYNTKKNKQISNLLFSKNGVIVNSISITLPLSSSDEKYGVKYFDGFKYWLNDCWAVMSYSIEEDNPYSRSLVYIFDFYSKEGSLLSSNKPSEPVYYPDELNLNEITPINMEAYIRHYDKYGTHFYRKMYVKDSPLTRWLVEINTKTQFPINAKIDSITSKLEDNGILFKSIYNITLYDGTKTTKTVTIDVNTGEYTVI